GNPASRRCRSGSTGRQSHFLWHPAFRCIQRRTLRVPVSVRRIVPLRATLEFPELIDRGCPSQQSVVPCRRATDGVATAFACCQFRLLPATCLLLSKLLWTAVSFPRPPRVFQIAAAIQSHLVPRFHGSLGDRAKSFPENAGRPRPLRNPTCLRRASLSMLPARRLPDPSCPRSLAIGPAGSSKDAAPDVTAFQPLAACRSTLRQAKLLDAQPSLISQRPEQVADRAQRHHRRPQPIQHTPLSRRCFSRTFTFPSKQILQTLVFA